MVFNTEYDLRGKYEAASCSLAIFSCESMIKEAGGVLCGRQQEAVFFFFETDALEDKFGDLPV